MATGLRDALDLVAQALDYPSRESARAARMAAERCRDAAPDLAAELRALAGWLEVVPPGRAEEAYTRLFDFDPASSLHLGWHLFGEHYKRGELLVQLGMETFRAGLRREPDLPDHLGTVLRLLSRLPDGDDRRLLVEGLVLPALAKLSERLARSEAPWGRVVLALPAALSRDVAGEAFPEVAHA
jgi:nitrate reductase molybdenum cofactor assembly chaperone